ncbi:hypothetical protein TNCV_3895881 [Trichonephila clavipes]|nr:hypothetical protein TNCV_3895881 [Trichonephila clavipes]
MHIKSVEAQNPHVTVEVWRMGCGRGSPVVKMLSILNPVLSKMHDKQHKALKEEDDIANEVKKCHLQSFSLQPSHISAFAADISGNRSRTRFLEVPLGNFPFLPESLRLSISLHPASGGKKSLLGQGVAREVQGRPCNNFRGAGCTCDDYFHKEVDSQLGGGKRYRAM